MPRPPVFLLTIVAMVAFAGNSLLCRLALQDSTIGAATFTSIRIVSGASVLWLIVRLQGKGGRPMGNWLSALALFAYAAGFSFAYIGLTAGTGSLLLFGAVQATMIGYGFCTGESLQLRQVAGLVLAFGGLVGLLLPGLTAPPLAASGLMLIAGIAWGIYSLRGRGSGDPIQVTAGNFMLALPFALVLELAVSAPDQVTLLGISYAVASGALASGVGYSIWYAALKELRATHAATVQLSVPVIAAIGGLVFLGEQLTLRLVFASVAILGGIALVILGKVPAK